MALHSAEALTTPEIGHLSRLTRAANLCGHSASTVAVAALCSKFAAHDVQADATQGGVGEGAGDGANDAGAQALVELDGGVIRPDHGVELHAGKGALAGPVQREAAERGAHASPAGIGRDHEARGCHMRARPGSVWADLGGAEDAIAIEALPRWRAPARRITAASAADQMPSFLSWNSG